MADTPYISIRPRRMNSSASEPVSRYSPSSCHRCVKKVLNSSTILWEQNLKEDYQPLSFEAMKPVLRLR